MRCLGTERVDDGQSAVDDEAVVHVLGVEDISTACESGSDNHAVVQAYLVYLRDAKPINVYRLRKRHHWTTAATNVG